MDQINKLIAFLQFIIPTAAGLRIGYCMLISSFNEEDRASMKVRARNALNFSVLAEGILAFTHLILNYF